MNRLRICIGLIAAAILVSALPAHAGTTFRTAKVCAQTESGIKITKVKFTWTYPGTVGGSGTTDKTGCFTATFMPVGDVTFKNARFRLQHASVQGVREYSSKSYIVPTSTSGPVYVTLPNPMAVYRASVVAKDPSGNVVPSRFRIAVWSTPTTKCNQLATFEGLQLRAWQVFLTDDVPVSFRMLTFPDWTLGSQQVINSPSLFFRPPRKNSPATEAIEIYYSRVLAEYKDFNTYIEPCTVRPAIEASAQSGTQKLSVLSDPLGNADQDLVLTYSEYLQGFKGLTTVLKAKTGKAALTSTLRDNQNQPMVGIPVTVSEPKSTNPNIGKKVGSCKPVLTATTNAQGKATFTLCPTKNTTVTVKAPPLGIVSQSITVTK